MNDTTKDVPQPLQRLEQSTDESCSPGMTVVKEITALFERAAKRNEHLCLLLPQWLHHIRTKGQPDWSACALLGEVLYWHRANPAGKKKFAGSKWHANTRQLAEKFGLRPESVRRVFHRLNKLGLLDRELRYKNDAGYAGRYVYITPNVDRVFDITFGELPRSDVAPKATGVSGSSEDVSARGNGRERLIPAGVSVVTNTSVPNKSSEQAPKQAPVPPSAVRECVPSTSSLSEEDRQINGLINFWALAHEKVHGGLMYQAKTDDEKFLRIMLKSLLKSCDYNDIPKMMYWCLSVGQSSQKGEFNEFHKCGVARRYGLAKFCQHWLDINLELEGDIPRWVKVGVKEIYAEVENKGATPVCHGG